MDGDAIFPLQGPPPIVGGFSPTFLFPRNYFRRAEGVLDWAQIIKV